MRAPLVVRVVGVAMLAATLAACITVLAVKWVGSAWLAALTALLIALPASWWGAQLATDSWSKVVRAVRDGVLSLRDHDFSMSITPVPNGELRELVSAYNSLGDLLRRERLDLYQRRRADVFVRQSPNALGLCLKFEVVLYFRPIHKAPFRYVPKVNPGRPSYTERDISNQPKTQPVFRNYFNNLFCRS